jgi:hypothetical protein
VHIVDKLKIKIFIGVNVIYIEKIITDFLARLVFFEVLKDFVINIQIRARNN